MEKILMKKSVKEIIDSVNKGEYIREVYQRTPSHTKNFALDIINSLVNNGNINLIHLAEMESEGKFAIIDGSSRINDVMEFIGNNIGIPTTAVEVYTNGKGGTMEKIVKSEKMFNDFSKDEQAKILNTKLDVIIYKGLEDINARYSLFLQLNNSTALSNCQKSKGLSSELLEDITNKLSNYNIIKSFVSARNIQKDELYAISVLLLGLISSNYSSSYATMLNNVKQLTNEDIDKNKIYSLLDILEQAFDNEDITVNINKYNICYLLNELYYMESDALNSLYIDNNLFPTIETMGANSGKKHEERQKLVAKVLKKALKTKVDAAPAIPQLEEIGINELIK